VFDPIVINPGRLKILAALSQEPRQPFVQLRAATRLTDGNLSTHARRLASAGLVRIDKSIDDGKPLTMITLTSRGRDALAGHAAQLSAAMQTPASSISTKSEEPDSDWID
jgi:DNA-binding MarR family transcriptional regulator